MWPAAVPGPTGVVSHQRPEPGGFCQSPRPRGWTSLWQRHPVALAAGSLSFAHLGATAGKLTAADRVLLGNPDVLIIGVGGGSKIYTAEEAAGVVN